MVVLPCKGLDFSLERSSWCSNPCTRVIAHFKQGAATSAESLLPQLPSVPMIQSIEVGNVELDPRNQHATLHVQLPESSVVSFRVRIIHYELNATKHWKRHQRVLDTFTPDTNITVTGLASGTYYSFQVAAVNEVDEGPYSATYPDRKGILIGKGTAIIEPRVSISRPTASDDICLAVEYEGVDVVNRAPNWLSWRVKVTITALPINQAKPAIVEFSDGTESFRCTDFETDPNTSLVIYCKIPCNGRKPSEELTVNVWDSSLVTKIAEGHLVHEAMSGTSCNRFFPTTPVFCNVSDPNRQQCMPAAVRNGSVCDACTDAQTDKTYQVSPTLCTSFFCTAGQFWCPLLPADSSGCIIGGCAGCGQGSVPRDHPTGGKICTLPCRIGGLPTSVRASAPMVAPGSSTTLVCNAGFMPIWNDLGESTFDCPVDNVLEVHDASVLQLPECSAPCLASSINLGQAGTVQHGDMRVGEEVELSCPFGGTIRLLCSQQSEIEKVQNYCQDRDTKGFGLGSRASFLDPGKHGI